MKIIGNILKWVWQLPQHLIAVALKYSFYPWMNKGGEVRDCKIIETYVIPSGVCLGKYIFVSPEVSDTTILHECGHSKQSLYLGPLYLIGIGIPSAIHSIVWSISYKLGKKWNYYSFYTEKWADKLAHITRK